VKTSFAGEFRFRGVFARAWSPNGGRKF